MAVKPRPDGRPVRGFSFLSKYLIIVQFWAGESTDFSALAFPFLFCHRQGRTHCMGLDTSGHLLNTTAEARRGVAPCALVNRQDCHIPMW